MAGTNNTSGGEGAAPSAKPASQKIKKLPPIPKGADPRARTPRAHHRLADTRAPFPRLAGAKVQKRPLTRRQLPSSSKTPVVYVSSSTPFMSAVKRIRKHLDRSLRNATAAAPRNVSLHARVEGLKRRAATAAAAAGTGAAVGDADDGEGPGVTRVTVMGTGRAVEKVLRVASYFEQEGDCEVALRTGTVGAVDDIVPDEGEGEDESRVRMVSCLEVVVSLK
ncbi:ribonuclease P/MRP, subunit POP7 [Purpureocillium lavendulum]|uniref:Ribonuclease P/MRP, subunit POP7 n=1 Tax=Purpureocillium lavendulum TaxID=1247861 RepID=A0AB34G8N4_9HYPO|nr:ribonuclease P/MRP, subunit POP7 [Purpureocillium lavendulum]